MQTIPLITLALLAPLFVMAETFQRSAVESETTPQGTRVDRFTLYSPSMDREIQALVVLPPAYDQDADAQFPILYTLHGRGAPFDTWAAMPKLHQQLSNMPFIFTCFDADRASFYLDADRPVNAARKKDEVDMQSSQFQTFFFEEFIPAIDAWYRVNPDKRGVTGFSMGGAGALNYGLAHPELFTGVSGLSTAVFELKDPDEKRRDWLEPLVGTIEENPERYASLDHYNQIDALLAKGVALPPIYQHIGTEDYLIEYNRKLRDFAEEKGLDFTYVESAGEHNYQFWHPASVGVAEFHWQHFQD